MYFIIFAFLSIIIHITDRIRCIIHIYTDTTVETDLANTLTFYDSTASVYFNVGYLNPGASVNWVIEVSDVDSPDSNTDH